VRVVAAPEEQAIVNESRERVTKHMAGLDGLSWDNLSEKHRRVYRGDAGLTLAIELGPILMGGPIAGFRARVAAAVKVIIGK
jgi:hypothetical protein